VPTLDKVSVDIQVVLGNTWMPVHQVLRLGRGAIIELDSSEDDEVHILANNLPVARGTVITAVYALDSLGNVWKLMDHLGQKWLRVTAERED